MKFIFIPIFNVLYWITLVTVGIIYSTLYFIWSPEEMINEKLEAIKECKKWQPRNLFIETIKSKDFWCPFFDA